MPTTPTEVEVVYAAIKARLLDVHVCLVGVIDKYDAATQTASVQVAVNPARLKDDRSIAYETMPIIPNVPVQFLKGGGFFASVPLKKGDPCQLVFNEVDPSVWLDSGEVPSNPSEIRRHSIGHPFCIPGGGPTSLASASDTDMVIGLDGGGVISIEPGGDIHIGANAVNKIARADKVNDELDAIASAITNHTHGALGLLDSNALPCTGSTAPAVMYTASDVDADKGFVE